MLDIGTILTTLFTLYAIAAIVFLISENRNPQATLAWMLAFLFVPGLSLLLYLFFGRDRKAFSRQRSLSPGRRSSRARCRCCARYSSARMRRSSGSRAAAPHSASFGDTLFAEDYFPRRAPPAG